MRLIKLFVSGVTAAVIFTTVLTPATMAQQITSNVPNSVRKADDLGLVDFAKEINITVHLKLQNEAAFDKAVDALYDPASPTFHKWMTDEDLKTYEPSREQFEALAGFVHQSK